MENIDKVGAIGKPGYLWQAKVVDEQGNEVPQGQVGELIVCGPGVMQCYYKNPEATAEVLKGGLAVYRRHGRGGTPTASSIWWTGRRTWSSPAARTCTRCRSRPSSAALDKIKDVAVIGMPDARLGRDRRRHRGGKGRHDLHGGGESTPSARSCPGTSGPARSSLTRSPATPTGKIEKPVLREKYCPRPSGGGPDHPLTGVKKRDSARQSGQRGVFRRDRYADQTVPSGGVLRRDGVHRPVLPPPHHRCQRLCAGGGGRWGPWLTAFAYGTSYFSAVVFVGYAGQFGWRFGIAATWAGPWGNAFLGVPLLAWVVLGRRTRIMTQHLDSGHHAGVLRPPVSTAGRLKLTASVIIFIFLIPYTASLYNGLSRLFAMAFHIDYARVRGGDGGAHRGCTSSPGGTWPTAINDFIQGIHHDLRHHRGDRGRC